MVDQVGQQFGNYRLTRLLGSGGFAEVYLGEHIHLGIPAAIKVLTTKLAEDEVEQFRNEARTMIGLKHQHVMRVLDFGLAGRIPFIVMDYAPSGSLRKIHSRGTRLPLSTILNYVQQIAAALQYVHDQKLIHRDVKPENMLLGCQNEVLLSDFGITAVAHSTRSLKTQDGSGTIYYMAPEQIQGRARPASDQYALGIVVYEWLCGVCPFEGATPIEIAMSHLTAPPPSLRTKVPTIPVEVEEVVLKALAKEPQQRFTSVEAFAEALGQASQPAKPAVRDASPAQRAPVSPPSGTLLCTYHGHTSLVYDVAWSPDGKRLASAGHDLTVQVWDAQTGQRLLTYHCDSDAVYSVAWSPDGTQLASTGDILFSDETVHRTVQVWDTRTGQRLLTYTGHDDTLWSVAWSPDGTRLASASVDLAVQVWNAQTGQRLLTYVGNVVAWSPDGTRLASASDGQSDGQTVQVWDARTGQRLLTYKGHSGAVWSVAWSPDGKRLASAGDDQTVQVWDARTGQRLLTYKGHSSSDVVYSHMVYSVAWSPDGTQLASASTDQTVQVWDARVGQRLLTYTGHSKGVRSVAWSPDGKRLASAGDDQTVQVWQAS